jgi:AcrR family transcriptional regulator
MGEGKTDLRIRYTREILRKSLLELMGTSPINQITVTDVCRKAGVNRGTFYKHYDTPYDLLAQIQDELYQSIAKSVEKTVAENTNASVLQEIFAAIAENGDICRVLLSENGDKDFLGRIMDIAHDRMIVNWKAAFNLKDTENIDMIYAFIVNGSVGVIQGWIDGGLKQSPHDMALFIDTITNQGIYAGLGRKAR